MTGCKVEYLQWVFAEISSGSSDHAYAAASFQVATCRAAAEPDLLKSSHFARKATMQQSPKLRFSPKFPKAPNVAHRAQRRCLHQRCCLYRCTAVPLGAHRTACVQGCGRVSGLAAEWAGASHD